MNIIFPFFDFIAEAGWGFTDAVYGHRFKLYLLLFLVEYAPKEEDSSRNTL